MYIADDHSIIRQGLRSFLATEDGIEVVGEESNGERALASIRALRPNVAVLDIQMPGLSGIEVARKLNDEDSHTSVLVLSMHTEDHFVEAAMSAGAVGYILKGEAGREISQAVHATARGESYISPQIAGTLVKAMRQKPGIQPKLSGRERDVLRLLSEGLSSKAIASTLGLAPKTVEGNRAAIMDKLGIRSVAGLVKYAIRNHLTSPSD